jgi:hypothetical protein
VKGKIMNYFFQLPAASLLFGASCSFLAYKNQKNSYFWFAIGLCFGIFGLIFLFFYILIRNRQKSALKKQPVGKEKEELALVHSLASYSESMWYYVDAKNQQVGPISHNLLNQKIQNGTISISSLVWNEHLSEWKKLQELLATVKQ